MNRQKGEDRLDELIARTINTAKPQFNSEKWKKKYPGELEILLSRKSKTGPSGQPSRLRGVLGNPVAILSAAEDFVIAALFMLEQIRREPEPMQIGRRSTSAVELVTAISLESAYRRGGIEAVEDQCRKVFRTATHESAGPSALQLLGEQNGRIKVIGGNKL